MKCLKVNNTEKEHMIYRYGVPINGSQFVDIDAFSVYKTQMNTNNDNSFLLRINDGRINIFKPATNEDRVRINCRFVSVLANGWPLILVQTIKPIKAGQALWTDYGSSYHNVLNQIHTINDQTNKMISCSQHILNNIDLRQEVPFNLDLITDNVTKNEALERSQGAINHTPFMNTGDGLSFLPNIPDLESHISTDAHSLPCKIKKEPLIPLILPNLNNEYMFQSSLSSNSVSSLSSDQTSAISNMSSMDFKPNRKRKRTDIEDEDKSLYELAITNKRRKFITQNEECPVFGGKYLELECCSIHCIQSVRMRFIPPDFTKERFIKTLDKKYYVKVIECSNLKVDPQFSPFLIAPKVKLSTKKARNVLIISAYQKLLNAIKKSLLLKSTKYPNQTEYIKRLSIFLYLCN